MKAEICSLCRQLTKDISKRAKVSWAREDVWGGVLIYLEKTNKSVVVILWDSIIGFCAMSFILVIDFIIT